MATPATAAQRPQLFTNVNIFDGSGSGLAPGEVLVEGNRIKAVAGRGEVGSTLRDQCDVVDGRGGTLMPGLVDSHCHITYSNFTFLWELGNIGPEEHLLLAMENARLMLMSGFTSTYSAATSKIRTEIVLRDAIAAGRVVGPRMTAASPELTSTGGLGDDNRLHIQRQGIEIVADGPDELRRVTRMLIREGVDAVKVNISGDNFVRSGFGRQCSYTDAEVAAIAEECHARGAWLSCHARADGAVRMALKHNFRVIYHCDFVEPPTYDLLEEKKDDIFLAPAIGIIYTTAYEAEAYGIDRATAEHMEMFTMLENCPVVYQALLKRGLRILPGGDYGFAWNPMGAQARDLEHFVKLIGFSPETTLMAATKWGGEIMGKGDELGQIREGYLADLLVVDGDPVQDITILQDRDRLQVIMKDGVYYKSFDTHQAGAQRTAAEKAASVWEM